MGGNTRNIIGGSIMSTSTIAVIVLSVMVLAIVAGYTYVYLRDKTLDDIRGQVYQLFLRAEHVYKESGSGKQKMKYVVHTARGLLPGWMQLIITDEFLEHIIQQWFSLIKDLLDDGKVNGSNNGGNDNEN